MKLESRPKKQEEVSHLALWGKKKKKHQQIEGANSLCKNPEARVCPVESIKTFFLIGEMWISYFSYYLILIDYLNESCYAI